MDFTISAAGELEDELDKPVYLDAMHCTKIALGKISLPLKVHFVPSKALHVQFDDGSQDVHTTGGFVILDTKVWIIWAG